ncbi:MAG: bifunctional hydroxymethylpyrimidine kinase/phosphomethylpyrimidine kinase [Alcaligenaceae bacterium]|nr:bifunctional hydroxymethylpyrimidine kinase/phosphomethylpyrimidine kinase [Alcaligenaceae bacterium]
MTQRTLTIAGVDPSGGAGVLADIKTMSALGTYACGVIAALTAQSTQGVTGVMPVPPEFIRLQLKTLFADVQIDGIKLGMLGESPVIEAVAEELNAYKGHRHCILDPVMVAKGGDHLLPQSSIPTLIEALIPQTTMITPNLLEAAILAEQSAPETIKQMYPLAEKLHKLFKQSDERWVLLKGGHLPNNELVDLLFNGDKMIELPNQRIDTKNTHGTGCTYSAAICALATRDNDIVRATQDAKEYLIKAIKASDNMGVGSGHGPLHHFHQWW